MERIGLAFTVVPLSVAHGGGRLVVIATGRVDLAANTVECSGITDRGQCVMVPINIGVHADCAKNPIGFLEVGPARPDHSIIVVPANTGRIATDAELGIVNGIPVPKRH